MLKATGLLVLAGAIAPVVQAQSCPAGSTNSFAAYDDRSPSATIVTNNTIFVGISRLQLSHQQVSSSMTSDEINDDHISGDIGVRIGHDGTATNATTDYIESTYAFRNPANMAQYLPVTGLTFRLHDIDAGDNIILNAYAAGSATPITLTTSHYSFDTSDGSTIVTYRGGNRFQSNDTDISNRRGTINFNFSGQNIERIVIRYYDDNDGGTYTVAGLTACNASLTLYKVTETTSGGPFGFTLTNTGRNAGNSISTTAADTPTQVDGSTATGMQAFTITNPATAVTITEAAPPSGWQLRTATCTNAAGATVGTLNLGGRAYTVPAGPTTTQAGAAVTCTFTNARLPILRVQKELPDGRSRAGDQFTLRILGGFTAESVTTSGTGSTATGTALLSPATVGQEYVVSEVAAGATNGGDYKNTYRCDNARAGGQAPSGNAASFNISPVLGDDLTCTFSNAIAHAQVTIRKTSVGGTGSFDFTGSNGIAAQTLTTTTAGTPVSGAPQVLASLRTATTITEGAPPANYLLTGITCTGLPGGGIATANLAARQVTLNAATSADADVTCTFTNTLQQADVRVQKTATPNPIQSGNVVTYTIIVNNDGPIAAHGTRLSDTPGTGLNCTAPSTTLSCTATGGAACPPAPVNISTLVGSGMTIPTLPAGGQVTATVQCTVTASGVP